MTHPNDCVDPATTTSIRWLRFPSEPTDGCSVLPTQPYAFNVPAPCLHLVSILTRCRPTVLEMAERFALFGCVAIEHADHVWSARRAEAILKRRAALVQYSACIAASTARALAHLPVPHSSSAMLALLGLRRPAPVGISAPASSDATS